MNAAPSILFVDDDVPLRETLSLYFRKKGIAVKTAGNSQDAMKMAEQDSFSAAILDIGLGGESGLDLLDAFKKKFPSLPVVMFTAIGNDPQQMGDAMARGASGYFSKTEALDTLFEGVRKVIA